MIFIIILRLPHATLLVLLSAATGARIIASDSWTHVANRLQLFLRFVAGDGRLLLFLDLADGPGVFFGRGAFDPCAADKVLVELLHLEDPIGHVMADGDPKVLEQGHTLAFVFDLG